MIPTLEGCFKLYKALNFKEIKMILGNPILNMQVNRVAKMSGLDKFSIIG
jgi:spore coat polysaccharide biosynthesis protein SpsF (cytidylyltransferase family)